jgi:hypothetical protein
MSDIEILPTAANDPEYNREGGIVVTPGSAHQVYMARFEQLPHSKWAFGNPGNPYVFRRWPAMMYHAERYLGQIKCMEGEPQRYEFQHDQNYLQAVEGAKHFTAKCIRIVNSQEEWARAMEEGWRDGPAEAIQACKDREDGVSQVIAHTNYEDRNMSEAAKAEKSAVEAENGNVPVAEVKRKYVRKTKKIATA